MRTPSTRLTQRLLAMGSGLLLVLAGAGCSPGSQGSDSSVIDYWLWDSAQQPGYQRCADEFEKQNPGLRIRITQNGWNDYWGKVTAGFIADQAPDVFTNHLTKYAQYAELGVLLPLDELGPTADISADDYQPGLAELWVGQDGHRYGAPKDWDTVGLFYDKSKVTAAGIDPSDLATMEWNPTDGGTFEKIVAHLTVDQAGVRGDEPGFDKNRVQVYGLGSNGSGGDGFGQTQWSPFTASAGWSYTDQNPWGTHYRFDDPVFQQTVAWYYSLAEKGYMPRYETFGQGSTSYQQFAAGRAALALQGSWMISTFQSVDGVDLAVAPTPIGPTGKRASMFNGLADSITRFADNPEAAARWVKFLSDDTCQDIIGEAGVVFPARASGTEKSMETRAAQGLDVSAFTEHIADRTTFPFPVTRKGPDITALVEPAMDGMYIGEEPVTDMSEVNEQVNRLFQYG